MQTLDGPFCFLRHQIFHRSRELEQNQKESPFDGAADENGEQGSHGHEHIDVDL